MIGEGGFGMAGQAGFFDLDERYAGLSASGDPLERLSRVVDFEIFREDLERALKRSERRRGGRPPMDAVMMFKVLVLQALWGLSDEQLEYQVRDRLSFMRFLGLDLSGWVPDYSTVWRFREALVQAGAMEGPSAALDLLLLGLCQALLRRLDDRGIDDLAAQREVAAPLQFRSKRANSPSIAPARSAFAADRQGFASEISGAISFH